MVMATAGGYWKFFEEIQKLILDEARQEAKRQYEDKSFFYRIYRAEGVKKFDGKSRSSTSSCP